jgi:hypothetical protein
MWSVEGRVVEDKTELVVQEEEVVAGREEVVEGREEVLKVVKVEEVLPCYETSSVVVKATSKPLADPPPPFDPM